MIVDLVFDDIQNRIDKMKLTLIEEILYRVIEDTPVLSGAARKGWAVVEDESELPHVIINTFEQFLEHMEAFHTGRPDRSGFHEYPEMQVNPPQMPNIPKGIEHNENIIIGNRVPYINSLNNGYSEKSNLFFIETDVMEVVEVISHENYAL